MQLLKAAGPQTKHIQSVYRNGRKGPFNSKLVADETTILFYSTVKQLNLELGRRLYDSAAPPLVTTPQAPS